MNRLFAFVCFAVLAAGLLLGTLPANAAITGSISGVVTDPSGAVVPGVTVVATSVSTNVQSKAVTDSKGFYRFPTLNVDTYNVTASQAGFRDYAQRGVKIDTNSALRIDISMELGSVTNTVSVKSDALQVETQSTQNGVVIEGTKITSVPLNGRSYIDLLKLQPGVSPYSHSQDSSTSGIGSTQVSGDLDNGQQSVNGGRSGSNAFMVNGANAEEGVHNGAAMIPNLDSIAQFRIITNNFDAEGGIGIDLDAALLVIAEARLADGYVVGVHIEGGKAIKTLRIGDGRALHVGRYAGSDDSHPWNDCSARIRDHSRNRTGYSRPCGKGPQNYKSNRASERHESHDPIHGT